MSDPLEAARGLLQSRRGGALVTSLADGSKATVDLSGRVVAGAIPGLVPPDVVAMIEGGRSGTIGDLFVEVLEPHPRLLVFGAGPIAESLCAMAATAGFVVEVGDPRPAFVREDRFPAAEAVRLGWPADLVPVMALDGASYAVSLLHEARFEDELLPALLRSEARYIGALGSRRTHEARRERLAALGFATEDIDRIRGPVGLDIGASTPAEIAVAILAEVVAIRRGRAG